jgi:hypothetical protein
MIQTATGAPSLRLAEWARRAGTSARKQRTDDPI